MRDRISQFANSMMNYHNTMSKWADIICNSEDKFILDQQNWKMVEEMFLVAEDVLKESDS